MILCHAKGCSSSKGVASHRFPLSPNAKILPARPQQLARCLQQGRKHLQRWAPRWYFNLSDPDEENSPGQSRSLEKKTVFLPEPGPGQHVQHFVKLIANWAGSGVERSCRWCVFSGSACSRDPPLHDQPPGPGGIWFEICPPAGFLWRLSCHY